MYKLCLYGPYMDLDVWKLVVKLNHSFIHPHMLVNGTPRKGAMFQTFVLLIAVLIHILTSWIILISIKINFRQIQFATIGSAYGNLSRSLIW